MQSVKQIEARAALIIADMIEKDVEICKADPEHEEKPTEALNAMKMFDKAGLLKSVAEWTLNNCFEHRMEGDWDPRKVLIEILDNALAY